MEQEVIYISGGSVKVTAGANTIGGGAGKSAVIPKVSKIDNRDVYLFNLKSVAEGAIIQLDNQDITLPKYHTDDTSYYLWLTGNNHSVTVGKETNSYLFENGEFILEATDGDVDVSVDNIEIYDDYYILNGAKYKWSGEIKITGQSTTNTVKVNTTTDKQIIFDGMSITNSEKSPFEIIGTGVVTIILSGDNTLTSTAENYAGLQKTNTNSKLIIKGKKEDNSDSLTATGGKAGAGIGGGYVIVGIDGGYAIAGKNIEINGGNITANGGLAGAGIGGGYGGAGINITISGGYITANGGNSGAGIGGGMYSIGSNIAISNAIVAAVGGENGAGIGGGNLGLGSDIYKHKQWKRKSNSGKKWRERRWRKWLSSNYSFDIHG